MSGMITYGNGIYGWKMISLGGRRGLVAGQLKMNSDGIAWRSKAGLNVTVVKTDLTTASWLRLAKGYELRLGLKSGTVHKFDGFADGDGVFLKKFLKEHYLVDLVEEKLSLKGANWGDAEVHGSNLQFFVEDQKAFEVPLNDVANATLGGKSNEINLEFQQDDTVAQGAETLVELKFYFGKQTSGEGGIIARDKAQDLLKAIQAKSAPAMTSSSALVTLEDITALVPRARFEIELSPTFMHMRGKSVHDYRINYSSIVRLFQLPKPDQSAMLFVLSLEPPIRQGHTSYPHIIMQLNESENMSLDVNLPPELETDEKMKQLTQIESGPTPQVVARLFKLLTDKRIAIPKTFRTKQGGRAVKALNGYLFPLERSFFFVPKPPTHFRFEEILSVELFRVSSDSTNRTFDFGINLRAGGSIMFKGILREEYEPLYNFLTAKELRILNLEGVGESTPQVAPVSDEESSDTRQRVKQALEMMPNDDEDESDEDFEEGGDEDNSESLDSEDIGSASDVEGKGGDLDDEIQEEEDPAKAARKAERKAAKKAEKKAAKKAARAAEKAEAKVAAEKSDEPSSGAQKRKREEEPEAPTRSTRSRRGDPVEPMELDEEGEYDEPSDFGESGSGSDNEDGDNDAAGIDFDE